MEKKQRRSGVHSIIMEQSDGSMASITTESEVNDEESKDVVLEMRNFVRADDPPISPRLSYLVTLDSRRQQVLIEFQTLLHNASTSSMCQHQHASDHQEPKLTKEIFCQVFSKREILELLFKLLDHQAEGKISQTNMIEFFKEKLGPENQEEGRIFVNLVDTLAYVYADKNDVDAEIFIRIFNSKGVIDKFYSLMDTEDSGRSVTVLKVMGFIAAMTLPRRTANLSAIDWACLEQNFKKMARDKSGGLTLEEFKKIVPAKNPFFAKRIFQIFDADKSGKVSHLEYREILEQFCGQSADDKLRFLFQIYDQNGDELIQLSELKEVLKASVEENGMKFSDEQLDQLTHSLFDDAVNSGGEWPNAFQDYRREAGITYEQLKAQMMKHPGLLDKLSINFERFLLPSVHKTKRLSFNNFSSKWSWNALRNNAAFICFIFAFLAVNFGLFVSRAVEFRKSNLLLIFARAAGQTLNFNCAFVVVLMLRRCITWLRMHGMSDFLPLDHHVYLHKLCGVVIVFFSGLHTTMHCINFRKLFSDKLILAASHNETIFNKALNIASNETYTASEWLFTTKPGQFGLIPGWACLTGWALVIILIVLAICSLPFVRKNGSFELFYWTHLLYIPFWICLIIHGPRFWKWFVFPSFLFFIEKMMQLYHRWTAYGQTHISSAVCLPSRVTHLVIKKPANFEYHPGDYVFVKIRSIASSEWHPFTISSAPELPDFIWLHVRAAGGWTNKLYDYFEREHARVCIEKCAAEGLPPCVRCSQKLEALDSSKGSPSRKVSKNVVPTVSSNNNSLNVAGGRKLSNSMAIHGNGNLELNTHCITIRRTTNNSSELNNNKSVPSVTNPVRRKISTMSPSITTNNTNIINKVENRRLFRSISEDQYQNLHIGVLNVPAPQVNGRDPIRSQEALRRRKISTPRGTFAPETIQELPEIPEVTPQTIRQAPLETEGIQLKEPLEIAIDGPYGAPSSHIFHASHAVLIAAGIGVTPFASILQSIMNRYYASQQICPRCEHCWATEMPESIMNLKKVDFFWINRDQRSFEWFVHLLSQLEMEQAELGGVMDRFLDLHMYITSALKRTDMKAVGLQLALDLLHENEHRDLVTGLKTRTNAGRPNWDKVFQKILDQNKGKVTVFYCGPPRIAKELRKKCYEFGFSFRKEIF